MMGKESVIEVWDRFWSNKQELSKVYPSSPSVLYAIMRNFRPQGMNIMEVGAGSGRDSVTLARLGAEVTVLDYSEKSLEIIQRQKQEHNLDNLHLVQGDALYAPFADNTFDMVFHQGLLEHFRDPYPLLVENRRILKAGGYCLCDVPQTFHIYTIVKKILIAMDKWFAGWETQYTMSSLKRLMRSTGFEIHHTYGDWMRPCFFYRLLREVLKKMKLELPMYPLKGSRYDIWKNRIMDSMSTHPIANYTQLSIGVIGRKLLLQHNRKPPST